MSLPHSHSLVRQIESMGYEWIARGSCSVCFAQCVGRAAYRIGRVCRHLERSQGAKPHQQDLNFLCDPCVKVCFESPRSLKVQSRNSANRFVPSEALNAQTAQPIGRICVHVALIMLLYCIGTLFAGPCWKLWRPNELHAGKSKAETNWARGDLPFASGGAS